jgi:hypothetical protein
LRRAAALVRDAREVVDFRVIVFLAVVFFGVAWDALADWAADVSTGKLRQTNAVRMHQRRDAFTKRGKITGNPMRDSWLQIVSAF